MLRCKVLPIVFPLHNLVASTGHAFVIFDVQVYTMEYDYQVIQCECTVCKVCQNYGYIIFIVVRMHH